MKSPHAQALEHNWQSFFDQLPAYRQPDGTLYVPKSGPGGNPKLWAWCAYQRSWHRRGRMAPEHAARLEEAGFSWVQPQRRLGALVGGKCDAKWDQLFQEALAFKAQHGHWYMLSNGSEAYKRLDNWASGQREKHREGTLRADRLARLTAAGFPWLGSYRNEKWGERYAELVRFKKQHGHVAVTETMPGLFKLARWCRSQCALKRKGLIQAEHFKLLDAIGFRWGEPVFLATHTPAAYQRVWEQRMAEFAAFKARFGHGIVPSRWCENDSLAMWVATQRKHARCGKLKPEHQTQLDALGFVWHVVAERRRLAAADPALLAEVKKLAKERKKLPPPQAGIGRRVQRLQHG